MIARRVGHLSYNDVCSCLAADMILVGTPCYSERTGAPFLVVASCVVLFEPWWSTAGSLVKHHNTKFAINVQF